MQLSFFDNHEDDENEMQLEVAMVGLRNKYGKNALLKGFNLSDKTAGIKRNTMVGGHNDTAAYRQSYANCTVYRT